MPSETMAPREGAGTRERKNRETRLRIAEEGLRLFSAQGYDEVTLEKVALAARVSPRTLYHHFKTKFEILLFFHDEGFVRDIKPTLHVLDPSQGAYAITREGLLQLVPRYETADLLVADRIWHSTPTLVAQKQLKFLLIEEAIADALAEIWPERPRMTEFRLIGLIAAGALRLAMEAGRNDDAEAARPLRDRLEDQFRCLARIGPF